MASRWRLSPLFPPGVFTRNRLDWAVEGAMATALSVTTTGANMPACSIYNDQKGGRSIAVMSILAWSSGTPPIVQAEPAIGTDGSPAGIAYSLRTLNPVSGGAGYTNNSVVAQPTASPMYWFLANGIDAFRLHGAPLAILLPGWRFEIFYGVLPSSDIVRPSTLTASFIWTPY